MMLQRSSAALASIFGPSCWAQITRTQSLRKRPSPNSAMLAEELLSATIIPHTLKADFPTIWGLFVFQLMRREHG